MKRRKTRVQKLESELRQAKKCISDLEVIVHAQNLTLLGHDKKLSKIGALLDSERRLKDRKVKSLQESERHLNGIAFVHGQKLKSIEQKNTFHR